MTWNSPEELVTLAEEATEPPPLPEGGIPRQKVPSWIRWPIRVFMLPFVVLDLTAQRIARLFFKTPYRQVGECLKRGNCCYYILFPAPDHFLAKIFYFWHTEINGFFQRESKQIHLDETSYVVMGCRYLKEDGSCGHYRLRPTICRAWPQIEIFGPPRYLRGCGFKAVPRDKNFDPYPQEKSNKLNILKD